MADHALTPPPRPLSITVLGIALAETEHAYRRLDDRTTGRRITPVEKDTETLLSDREWALRSLIATLPANTLADAAVQLGTVSAFTSILDCSEWTDPDTHERLHELHRALNRIALSVLPVVANAAGLNLAAMAWDHADELRAGLFFGGEPGA